MRARGDIYKHVQETRPSVQEEKKKEEGKKKRRRRKRRRKLRRRRRKRRKTTTTRTHLFLQLGALFQSHLFLFYFLA